MAKKKKILVVDDEPNIRLLVKNMLGNRYNVVEAGDGNEAVTKAQEEKPDVVLLDILMPGKDGFTTCNQLKANKATKDIPVVMVTALQHKLDEKLALSLKADGYMRKPFTSEDLLNAIHSVLSAKHQK
ncbi:Alkaline phosphatase synthesis transcriptional regulatory protein PhoP [subsurface metagenome]|nr:response regulator [Dehalococcoidia bacterium]